jgi:hypothetical protein
VFRVAGAKVSGEVGINVALESFGSIWMIDHAIHWGCKKVLDDPLESYFVYAEGFGTKAGAVVDSERDVGVCDGC